MPGSGTLAPPRPCCNGATCARGIPPAPRSHGRPRDSPWLEVEAALGEHWDWWCVSCPQTPQRTVLVLGRTRRACNAHSVLVFRAESSALQMGSPEAAWRHHCPSAHNSATQLPGGQDRRGQHRQLATKGPRHWAMPGGCPLCPQCSSSSHLMGSSTATTAPPSLPTRKQHRGWRRRTLPSSPAQPSSTDSDVSLSDFSRNHSRTSWHRELAGERERDINSDLALPAGALCAVPQCDSVTQGEGQGTDALQSPRTLWDALG